MLSKFISKKIKEAHTQGLTQGYKRAEDKFNKELAQETKKLKDEHTYSIKKLKKEFQQIIIQKNQDIKNLRHQINDNRKNYNDLRNRENKLDCLAQDLYNTTETTSVRIQEALQPILRLAAQMEKTKRDSNKKDDKIINMFEISK